MKTLLALLLSASIASAQTCPSRLNLRPVSAQSRGGTIIWKSNWNVNENREQTISEGNHSQKGAALLVQYKASKLVPQGSSIEVRDASCKLIARLGRYPRCTEAGCGEHERWYLRAPGGSYLTVPQLVDKAGSVSVLIRLQGRQWAVIQNVYDEREIR